MISISSRPSAPDSPAGGLSPAMARRGVGPGGWAREPARAVYSFGGPGSTLRAEPITRYSKPASSRPEASAAAMISGPTPAASPKVRPIVRTAALMPARPSIHLDIGLPAQLLQPILLL